MSMRRRPAGFRPISRNPDPDLAIPCTYCGEPANTQDHIVPTSVLAMISDLSKDARKELLGFLPPLIKVYACRQCNSVLGNRLFRNLKDRRAAVKDYLRRHYARVLDMPDWTEGELVELGHSLQSFVRNRLRQREEVCERLAWHKRLPTYSKYEEVAINVHVLRKETELKVQRPRVSGLGEDRRCQWCNGLILSRRRLAKVLYCSSLCGNRARREGYLLRQPRPPIIDRVRVSELVIVRAPYPSGVRAVDRAVRLESPRPEQGQFWALPALSGHRSGRR